MVEALNLLQTLSCFPESKVWLRYELHYLLLEIVQKCERSIVEWAALVLSLQIRKDQKWQKKLPLLACMCFLLDTEGLVWAIQSKNLWDTVRKVWLTVPHNWLEALVEEALVWLSFYVPVNTRRREAILWNWELKHVEKVRGDVLGWIIDFTVWEGSS
jgi:hypothetical protein